MQIGHSRENKFLKIQDFFVFVLIKKDLISLTLTIAHGLISPTSAATAYFRSYGRRAVWPDLAKFRHLGKLYKVIGKLYKFLGKLLSVIKVFGKNDEFLTNLNFCK